SISTQTLLVLLLDWTVTAFTTVQLANRGDCSRESVLLMSAGRLFQRRGAERLNALSPMVDSRADGVIPTFKIKHQHPPSDTDIHHQTPASTLRHRHSKSNTSIHPQTLTFTIKHQHPPSDTDIHHQTPASTLKH
ncbi:hypothetical protein QTP86_027583, partial [Hemibagrus guttatus]